MLEVYLPSVATPGVASRSNPPAALAPTLPSHYIVLMYRLLSLLYCDGVPLRRALYSTVEYSQPGLCSRTCYLFMFSARVTLTII